MFSFLNSTHDYLFYGVILLIGVLCYLTWQYKSNWNILMRKGYTPTLDMYAKDLTALARTQKLDPVIGRDQEITRVMQILSRRTKDNPLLLGHPGVGKTAIAEGLALKIATQKVPASLLHKRVLALDMPSLISGTKYRGEFEKRLKSILQEIELSDRSIILFIDEVHILSQSQGAEGAINPADILKPALAKGWLQTIGATTRYEYEHYIAKDITLERRFQPVQIDEPDIAQTIQILAGIKSKYEQYHGVVYAPEALQAAVVLTGKYIQQRYFPDKAIDVIDEAAAMVILNQTDNQKPLVDVDDIKKVIAQWMHVLPTEIND